MGSRDARRLYADAGSPMGVLMAKTGMELGGRLRNCRMELLTNG